MKKIIIFLVLGCTLLACKEKYTPQNTGYYVESPTEEVTGVITNEKGEPLQGMVITKYDDKELTKFSSEAHSDAKGRYKLSSFSRYRFRTHMEYGDFYLTVIDPTKVYQQQTLQAQMLYFFYVGAEDAVGQAEVNIVMTKK